ncbi:MAG: TonB-dependent receptor [Alphaproteobacteria bacterium]|nr:TonB-dependent receptor [Alphaproteobacteria bacterium]
MKASYVQTTAILLALGGFHAHAAHAAEAAAARTAPTDVAAVVVTGQFFDTGAKSAMKMNVPVLDTPYSVASYSDSFVRSVDTTELANLYSYMTGVKKAGNTGYDINLRGFSSGGTDPNAILVDGLPGLTGRYNSPPTVGIDRVELVKGPMSVLYGQMQPGGFVNMITKKPAAHAETMLQARGSTYAGDRLGAFSRNGYVLDLDTTGPVGADGKVRFRVIGELSNADKFRDFQYDHGTYVAPMVSWDLDEATTLTAQFEYRNARSGFDVGLTAPNNDISLVAPITTVYQEPGNYRSEIGVSETVFLDHEFANGLRWHTGARLVQYNSDQKEISSTGAFFVAGSGPDSGWRVQRRARWLQTDRKYNYIDSSLTDAFTLFGLENKAIVGVTLGQYQIHENRLKFFNSTVRNKTTGLCPAGGTCLDISLYDPVYAQIPDFDSLPATNSGLANQARLLTNRITKDWNAGLYYSDLIRLTDTLKVSLAGRTFSEHQAFDEMRAPGKAPVRRTFTRAILPSAGLLYQPSKHWTAYVSYAESFVPPDVTAQDINGQNSFQPVEATQYEAGLKTEGLWEGRVTATLALFRINETNVLTTFACDLGTCSQQVGEVRSDGMEFETNLRPLENWQVIFGYSHLNARTIKNPTDPFQVGKRRPNVADNSANIWSRYDLPRGFGLGLGVTYTGDREGVQVTSSKPTRLDLPAYTVVDAVIYYEHANWQANLKFGNLLDERYYESAGATGPIQIAPGAPRNITVSLSARF